ncbi:repeat protein [Moumouvirus goulette]|uniref:Repeat protein n=1 Tax=Moumouvirus goulette TaxID=1247379 RepID=M1NM67_9VIRU|nr:repeat protein [Moumouvirus goulette]AGF85120.1 repeat protein [Moumouvirus goulette]
MNLEFYYYDSNELSLGNHQSSYESFFLENKYSSTIHFSHKIYLYVICVNLQDPETSFCKLKNGNYRCNKINILKKYSIIDLSTFSTLNINKIYISIDFTIKFDYLKYLKIFDNYSYEIEFDKNIVNYASCHREIEFLNWLLQTDKNFIYTELPMNNASQYGKIDVLNWWINSGLELKYTEQSIDYISLNENNEQCYLQVLNWWLNSGLELKYTSHAMDNASGCNCINILNWWLNSGLELKYTSFTMDNTSICVLDWWLNSGLELKYSGTALKNAFYNEDIDSLNWWSNSGLLLKYYKSDIKIIKNKEILEWCKMVGII